MRATHEWEGQAHDRALAHYEACEEALAHEDDHDPRELCPNCMPQMSRAPYDGCAVCTVREILHAAYPMLAELAVATYLSLMPGEAPWWREEL